MNNLINSKQVSLKNNILNLVGRFLVGNIMNDVEVRDSLKGLASFNIACKTANRATKALLNGDEYKDGLKQGLLMNAEIATELCSMKVNIYKHHLVILNYLKLLWGSTNDPCLKASMYNFQQSFFGLLHYKTSGHINDFLYYTHNQGSFLNENLIKQKLGKPSKELHDVYLLMAKFLKECKDGIVVVGKCQKDLKTCIKCAEAAMNPYTYFEKKLKQARSFKAIVLIFIILVISFFYRYY